jgi:hypothetical protein
MPPRFDPFPRSHGYFTQFVPSFDMPPDQMERLSLVSRADTAARRVVEQRRALNFPGAGDYGHAEYSTASSLGSPLELNMQNPYPSAPLNYTSELFLPSAPGPPTVASEDDINEVITPEASSSLEPTVLLPGENNLPSHGPTSDPYHSTASAYYSGTTPVVEAHSVPRYTMGDVAGVCDEDMLHSCGWSTRQSSQQ